MRLTLEDSTTKIHAYVIAKNEVTPFYGYPGTEKLRRKQNKLLGVLEDSTTNTHAYVIAKNGETPFYGYLGTEKLRKKQNNLLGVRSFILE